MRRVAAFLAEINTFSTYVITGNNLLFFFFFDMWFIPIYTLAEGHQLISKMKREISQAIIIFKNSKIIGPYTALFNIKFCLWTLNITSPTYTLLMP